MVILKAKNPKTQQLVQLQPFKLPPSHKHLAEKPTFLEAKHFAATYGLFRVCNMRNIHMMLPPNYRDLWKGDFEALKKEDMKEGKGWMYEADPFATLREREEAKTLREKQRLEGEKARKKASNMPGGAGLVLRNDQRSHSAGAANGGNNIMKGWSRVPKVEMGKRTRTQVEELIRKHAIWNPHDVHLQQSQKQDIIEQLKRLDFRPSHIEEAVGECKDREETLEWLLIHVPEDDLPSWALPEGYVAGISMASSDLKREDAIKRLSEAGYAHDLCRITFDASNDEGSAAEALQKILLSSGRASDTSVASAAASEPNGGTTQEVWEEEMTSISSVFGDDFSRPSEDVCKIVFNPTKRGQQASIERPIVQVRRSRDYPNKLPVITIHAKLPAYIRLSIMKQALAQAMDAWIGEQMIFFLVDWLEQNIHTIIQQPGRLRDVFAAASTVSEIRPVQRRRPLPRHPVPLAYIPEPKSQEGWSNRQLDPKLQLRIQQRRSLPAWEMRDILVDTVNQHQVTIISGETGSGKSTQSAQFILDDLYSKAMGRCTKIM